MRNCLDSSGFCCCFLPDMPGTGMGQCPAEHVASWATTGNLSPNDPPFHKICTGGSWLLGYSKSLCWEVVLLSQVAGPLGVKLFYKVKKVFLVQGTKFRSA